MLATAEAYKQVRKQILQAQIDCDAARDEYLRAQTEVHYAEEAQRQLSEKYNLGTTDYMSWDTALIDYSKALYFAAELKYKFLLTSFKLHVLLND